MVAADSAPADWPGRYRNLLASAGLNVESVVGQALQAPDLDRPTRLSLARYLDQPTLLRQQLTSDFPDATDARALRAYLSVIQQDLALSVIAPLMLQLFRDGKAPLPQPEQIVLAPARGSSTAPRWLHLPSQPAVGVADFVRQLGALVTAWYPVFRRDFGVSPGAYWSSIGLGLGAPFSAVWNLAEAQAVCDLAQEWLDAFACNASRFIDWVPAELNGRQCAIPQRKGCCLKYQLPDGGYCGTCGIYRKARLAQASRRSRSPAPGQWLPAQ